MLPMPLTAAPAKMLQAQMDVALRTQQTLTLRLKDIDGQVENAQLNLQTLLCEQRHTRDQLAGIASELESCRKQHCPIQLLPHDILAHLFQTVAKEYSMEMLRDENPDALILSRKFAVKVASVCRAWRAVALQTSALWANIHLDFVKLFSSLGPPCKDGFDMCIERSRQTPLYLFIDNVDLMYATGSGLWRLVLGSLLDQAHRWRACIINASAPGRDLENIPMYLQRPTPLLELFRLRVEEYNELPMDKLKARVLPVAPRLRTLELPVPIIGYSVFAAMPELHDMTLIGCDDTVWDDALQIVKLLNICPHIRTLTIKEVEASASEGTDDTPQPLERLVFPFLTNLNLISVTCDTLQPWSPAFSFPALTSLELEGYITGTLFSVLRTVFVDSRVENLVVRDIQGDEETLLQDMFRPFPLLRNATFHSLVLESDELEELLKKDDTGQQWALCPRLNKLTFENSSFEDPIAVIAFLNLASQRARNSGQDPNADSKLTLLETLDMVQSLNHSPNVPLWLPAALEAIRRGESMAVDS